MLVASEGPATEEPERLAELRVRFDQPPKQLNIVTEDLEGYFLRTIPALFISKVPLGFAIPAITGIKGFVGTVAWWRFEEQ